MDELSSLKGSEGRSSSPDSVGSGGGSQLLLGQHTPSSDEEEVTEERSELLGKNGSNLAVTSQLFAITPERHGKKRKSSTECSDLENKKNIIQSKAENYKTASFAEEVAKAVISVAGNSFYRKLAVEVSKIGHDSSSILAKSPYKEERPRNSMGTDMGNLRQQSGENVE